MQEVDTKDSEWDYISGIYFEIEMVNPARRHTVHQKADIIIRLQQAAGEYRCSHGIQVHDEFGKQNQNKSDGISLRRTYRKTKIVAKKTQL
ncbi:hypothetical protein Y032_0181g843 [Ancylostoma ceylanicum]|nr:hypothetical protein Y032_0181g843 [Ancylostoma ceylanicum]